MPAYLVQQDADAAAATRVQGHDAIVVFAADATDALDAAAAHHGQDTNSPWLNAATATEIVAPTNASGLAMRVNIDGGVSAVKHRSGEVQVPANVSGVVAVAINAGGTGYTVNDILTVAGGTSTSAARLKVTSVAAGVIDGIEVLDPGQYTADPSLTANAVTGGTGASATMDLTMSADADLDALGGALQAVMVGLVPTIECDPAGGPAGVLQFTIPAGENLGDTTITADILLNGVVITSLAPTVSSAGAQASARTIDMPALASVLPRTWAAAREVF